MSRLSSHRLKRHLKAEHQRVEIVDLFSVESVVAHFNLVVCIPVKLRHPDGQLELFPEQLNVSLYPGNHPRLNARSYRNPKLKSKGLLGHIHQL